MKYFISMPMRGVPEEAVKEIMNSVKEHIDKTTHGEWIDTLIHEDLGGPLEYLGESIGRMQQADIVYFVTLKLEGRDEVYRWEYARGCAVEHCAALEYDKKIRYLTASKNSTRWVVTPDPFWGKDNPLDWKE